MADQARIGQWLALRVGELAELAAFDHIVSHLVGFGRIRHVGEASNAVHLHPQYRRCDD